MYNKIQVSQEKANFIMFIKQFFLQSSLWTLPLVDTWRISNGLKFMMCYVNIKKILPESNFNEQSV